MCVSEYLFSFSCYGPFSDLNTKLRIYKSGCSPLRVDVGIQELGFWYSDDFAEERYSELNFIVSLGMVGEGYP